MNSENSSTGSFGRFQSVLTRAALLALMAIQLAANAAEPVVQWAKIYGNPGNDAARDMALAPNGQVYLAGAFQTNVLLRFNESGTLLGSQPDRGASIRGVAVDPAGNYYLTGLIRNSEQLGVGLTNHFYLAKYSSGGSLIWERTGGSPGDPGISNPWRIGGIKIAVDAAGNIYVAGGSTGPATFSGMTLPDAPGGALLCKYAPNGNLLWVKRVESNGGQANSLALSPDGGIVITGDANKGDADFGGKVVTIAGPYGGYFFLAKYTADGDLQWAQQSHGGYGDVCDRQGNIYCTGEAISADPAGLNGVYCGKFTPAGEPVWEKVVPGAWANGGKVALDGKGEPVFSAGLYDTAQLDDITVPYTGFGSGGDYPEALICKVDANGHFQWALKESGLAWGTAGPVLCDQSGNIYWAGGAQGELWYGQYRGLTGMLGPFTLNVDPNNGSEVYMARLFDADAMVPELKIALAPSALALSWPLEATNFVLEAATSLPALSWDPVNATPTVGPTERSVQLPLTGNAKFFRLRRP